MKQFDKQILHLKKGYKNGNGQNLIIKSLYIIYVFIYIYICR